MDAREEVLKLRPNAQIEKIVNAPLWMVRVPNVPFDNPASPGITGWEESEDIAWSKALKRLRDQPQTTLSGRSEQAWLNHIATLFTIASPGEDIPWQALLAWTGTPTEEDFMWARKHLTEVAAPQAAVPESQDGLPLANLTKEA